MSTPKIGDTLGQYRIIDELGAGGMGMVFKAQDVRLGRLVALKVLKPAISSDVESVERFRREARTASSLNHSNICTIYNFDEQDGRLFLAMELLEGEPLDRKLASRPLDFLTVLDVGTQVADALSAAHAEGILHRDIKPANIFLTRRGQVKVLDFGLAKLASSAHRGPIDSHPTEHFTSMAGTTAGTVAYMSPEQARGDDLDPRTDLFSFGVVLYEMATGRQSFPGATTAVIFDGILNREPTPPSTLNAAIPTELDRIISKALEKERALRYQSAADMRVDLQRLKRDSGSRRVAVAGSLLDSSAETAIFQPGSTTRVPAAPASSAPSVASPSVSAPSVSAPSVPAPSVPAPTVAAPAVGRPWSRVSPLTVGAAALFLVGLVAMIGVAWVIKRSLDTAPIADQTISDAPSAASPPVVSPDASAAGTPAVVPEPSAAVSNTPAAGPNTSAVAAATPSVAAKTPAPAPKGPPVAPAPPAAPPVPANERPPTLPAASPLRPNAAPSNDVATTRLEIARAKISSNLLEPALGDLRQIGIDFPGSRAAAEALFMSAQVFEKLGRLDDAMATHVEFGKRFATDTLAAASQLRLAELTERSRRPNREVVAATILGDLIRTHPRTPEALRALQLKIRLDEDNRQRVMDPVLNVQVPHVLPTLRTLTEQFPTAPASMAAFNRLASMYSDLDQFERAAQAYADLATNFPNNPHDAWFRAGEVYERRLKAMDRAREAYAKVPAGTARYRDAQRKLNQRS